MVGIFLAPNVLNRDVVCTGFIRRPPISGKPKLNNTSDTPHQWFPDAYKRLNALTLISSAAVQLPPVPSPTSTTPGLVPLLSVLFYDALYHHVLQSRSLLLRRRCSLRQRFDGSSRPLSSA